MIILKTLCSFVVFTLLCFIIGELVMNRLTKIKRDFGPIFFALISPALAAIATFILGGIFSYIHIAISGLNMRSWFSCTLLFVLILWLGIFIGAIKNTEPNSNKTQNSEVN